MPRGRRSPSPDAGSQTTDWLDPIWGPYDIEDNPLPAIAKAFGVPVESIEVVEDEGDHTQMTCPVCDKAKHTPEELVACIASINCQVADLGTRDVIGTCWNCHNSDVLTSDASGVHCNVCGCHQAVDHA